MVDLPNFLRPFKAKAEELLLSKAVGEIQFSGPTYQVQFHDPNKEQDVWAFLHLDAKGQIQDSFCTCEESEGLNYCPHIAAAWLRIYNDHPTPLHYRLQRSL